MCLRPRALPPRVCTQVTLSNEIGETIIQHSLRAEPSELRFQHAYEQNTNEREALLSAVLGGKSVMVFDVSDPDTIRNSVELTYQPNHGPIVGYEWSSSSCIAVGFESGFISVDAVNVRDNRSEGVYSCRLFPGGLSALAVSPLLSRAAAVSGNTLKVIQLGQGTDAASYKELGDEELTVNTGGASLSKLEWTADGQILTIASDGGVVYNYLASLPVLAATNGSKYMYLTSLMELSVFDSADPSAPALEVAIGMEPTFVALGPAHVALGMNNHCAWHLLPRPANHLWGTRPFPSYALPCSSLPCPCPGSPRWSDGGSKPRVPQVSSTILVKGAR